MPPDRAAGVSRGTLGDFPDRLAPLEYYLALLERWQRAHNLVAPSTLEDAWNRHILDSAQLARLVPAGPCRLLDLGSGAGFPGLVLAILFTGRPDFESTLVESNGRKCAFLRTVARELSLPVTVLQARIESLADRFAGVSDVITARALAPLDRLCSMIAPLMGEATVALLPKGTGREAEITAARIRWEFDMEERQSDTDPAAAILILRNIQAKK